MTKHLRGFSVRSDPGGPIRFIASTSDVARDGIIIDAAAWQLDNFRRNPALMWAHRYDQPPIGKVTHIESVNGSLVADVEFDPNDEFARSIESKYRNGFLNAVSVGWDTIKAEPGRIGGVPRVTKAELLEISCVPVPSDPGALAIARSRYRALHSTSGDVATIRDLQQVQRLLNEYQVRLIEHQVYRVLRDVIDGAR